MYEAHFGLSGRPFGAASPFIPLPSRESALRRLRYGLDHAEGPVLLFGPPGVGKSRLVAELARGRRGPHVAFAYPLMPVGEIPGFLADEFGAPGAPSPEIGASLRRLRAFLAEAARHGERPLLIVDEAHLIPDAAHFDAFRLLLNSAEGGPADLALALVGGPETLGLLPPELADRLTVRALLSPLGAAESAAYLAGRVVATGGRADLFTPAAAAALHQAAEGLPRRLNHLADLCLLLAFGDERARVDVDVVEVADRERNLPELAA